MGAFEIRRYQSQLWWINPSPGKVKPLCRGRRGYNRWNSRRGWEAYSFCGRRYSPSACRRSGQRAFKAAGLLHILGATAT
ncbi:hypothetical protein ACNKHW_01285 [Shigella flexneri]